MDGSLRRDSLPLNHIFADNITLDKRERGWGVLGRKSLWAAGKISRETIVRCMLVQQNSASTLIQILRQSYKLSCRTVSAINCAVAGDRTQSADRQFLLFWKFQGNMQEKEHAWFVDFNNLKQLRNLMSVENELQNSNN